MSANPIVRVRADEEVANLLRVRILRGEYAAGATLPGERELSAQLGVSRLTLRASISRLEGEGLLRTVHGAGTRVLDYRAHGGVELLGHLLAAGVPSGDPLPLLENFLEVRRALAVEAIGMAADRCPDDELAALRFHVARQALLVGDPEAYVASDLALARRFAACTQNLALALLANSIVRLIEHQPGLEMAFMIDTAGSLAFYHRVLDLIERRDGARARRFARGLIERLDRRILDLLRTKKGSP